MRMQHNETRKTSWLLITRLLTGAWMTLLMSMPARAQDGPPTGFDLTGRWTALYHEDFLERQDPGSLAGDYLEIPINDGARFRADTWDADIVSVLEHQCIPHAAPYVMRGPSILKISAMEDPATGQDVAFVIDGAYIGPRTIWMDNRPHPGVFAAHTWAGFSTGVWQGDTLRIDTSHIKAGYLRRNGIPFSDQATLTEFIDLHDKYLTLTSVVEDPVYLTEPLVRSETWVWNPYQISRRFVSPGWCLPQPELPLPHGAIPSHLPGTNTVIKEFSGSYGIPFEATRGGAETIYPEYQKKLKLMTVPRPATFDRKFAREHETADAASSEKAQKK